MKIEGGGHGRAWGIREESQRKSLVFPLTLSILPPIAPIKPSKCLPNTAKLPASSNNLPPPPPTLLLAALAARLVLALPLTCPLPLV